MPKPTWKERQLKSQEEAEAWWEKLQAFVQEFSMWECQCPCDRCPFDVAIEGINLCRLLAKVRKVADSDKQRAKEGEKSAKLV